MTDNINNIPTESLQHRRNRPLWMPIYWHDYLGDTRHLNTLQHGAYLLLISAYWVRGGPLPNDAKFLRQVTGLHGNSWRYHSKILLDFFEEREGYLYHKRVESELLRSCDRIASAQRAAMRRWCDRNANHNHNYKEEEVSKKEAASPSAQLPLVPRETKKRTSDGSRGTRLPSDWIPSNEDSLYSVGLLGESRAAAAMEDFKDYWIAKPGKDGLKLDWSRTWRKWCRNEKDWKGNGNGSGYGREKSHKERYSDFLQSLGSGEVREDVARVIPKLDPI